MRPARTASASPQGRRGSRVTTRALTRSRSAGRPGVTSVGGGEGLRLLERHLLAAAVDGAVAGLGAEHFGAALLTDEALAKLVSHAAPPAGPAGCAAARRRRAAAS